MGKGLSILEVRQEQEVGQTGYGGSVGGRRAGEDGGGKEARVTNSVPPGEILCIPQITREWNEGWGVRRIRFRPKAMSHETMGRPMSAGHKKAGKPSAKQLPEVWPTNDVQREFAQILRPNTAPSYGSGFLLSSCSSFDGLDFELPASSPIQLYISSPLARQSLLVFNEVPPELSVAGLKRLIYERLLLTPHHALHLSSWGRMMDDQHTLGYYRLPSNARLQLHISPARADPERGLRRVRVVSTALRTRQFDVDATTTVLHLKQRVEEAMRCSEQVWYTSDGYCMRRVGATALVSTSAKPDVKLGTSAVRLGEELLIQDVSKLIGKGAASAFRALSGRPILVEEKLLVLLELPVAMQQLSFRGRLLADEELLWTAGVRNDDAIILEFTSPVMPKPLLLLRAPPAIKAARMGGKGKQGGAAKKNRSKSTGSL